MGVPDKPSHRTHTDPGSAGLADTGQPPVECRVLRRCVQSRSQWSPPPSLLHPRDSIRNIQEPPHVTPLDSLQSLHCIYYRSLSCYLHVSLLLLLCGRSCGRCLSTNNNILFLFLKSDCLPLYCTVQYSRVSTVQYSTVQYNTVQCKIVQKTYSSV